MGKNVAEIDIQATSSRLAAGLAAASSKIQSWSVAVARGIGNQFKGIGASFAKMKLPSTVSHALGNFGGDMMSRGFDALKDAAGDVHDFENELLYLQIATKKTPGQMLQLRKAFLETSKATGINTGEIARSSRAYFDLTSDAEGVTDAMSGFAVIAKASDSSMGDVNAAAAALRRNLGIMPNEMKDVFGAFVEQGNLGTIGIRNLAAELVNLLPQFKRFGVVGKEGAIQVNAAFQVIANDFGTSSEAATGLERLMSNLVARQAQLAAAGVNVFDVKNGVPQLRQFDQIIGDIRKKLPDERQWGKIFGENIESRRALHALVEAPKLLDDIVAAGHNAGDAIDRDFAMVSTSAVGRADLAMNRLKVTISEAITPERVQSFATAMERVANAASKASEAWGSFWDRMNVEDTNPNRSEHGTSGLAEFGVKSLLFGNQEAVRQELETDATARAGLRTKAMFLPPGTAGDAARRELAYDAAKMELDALPKNSEERKKRALGLATGTGAPSTDQFTYVGGGGREGQAQAAREALKEMGIGAAQANTEMIGLLKTIAANTAASAAKPAPDVKIGADSVYRAAKKSTLPRAGR